MAPNGLAGAWPSALSLGSLTAAAAPAMTAVPVAGNRDVDVSRTSATMQVMLSGPPPCSASSISWRAAASGSVIVASVSRSTSSLTTPDSPSEQSR